MAGQHQKPYTFPFTDAWWGKIIDLRIRRAEAGMKRLRADMFIRSIRSGDEGDASFADIFDDIRDYYATRDHLRSLQPRGPRARTGGRPPIDPELAERAAQMKAEAKTEKEIAISLLPGMDPTSAKARGKVRRLVERGQA